MDEQILLAFVAGTFIYISCTDLMNEVLQNNKTSFKDVLIEILGLIFGCYLSFLV